MDNMHIYNATRNVPESAKKKITGGRLNGKTDINPMWRIKTLTEQFGACGIGWYYKVIRQWTEAGADVVAAFVNIELFVKVNGEWSEPIFGNGGSMFVEKEKSGFHVSDECFKMATTDALSVACKQLGIGADVYWEKDATKYESPKENELFSENDRLKPVFEELNRIGYSVNSVCNKYKVDNIGDITDLQIKDFLQKASKLPDREK